MEALVLILIEALAGPIIALVSVIAWLLGSLLSSLFTVLLEILFAWFLSRPKRTAVASNQPATPPKATSPIKPSVTAPQTAPVTPVSPHPPYSSRPRPRWVRWLTITTASIAGLGLLTLLAINQWFLDDVARWLMNRQPARTGITITFESLTGNLFSGHFNARGVTVQRRDHPSGLIDLSVKQLDIDIAVWRVLANPLVVDSLVIDGVSGRYERGVPGQPPAQKPSTTADVTSDNDNERTSPSNSPKKTKRPFHLNALTITNLDVAYADHTRKRPLAVPLTLTTFTSRPLRSQWAVLDVLFHANASGTLAARPLTITTTGVDDGRNTQWHIDGLPVEFLAAQIGGPFALLTSGSADVQVINHWRRDGDRPVIVMDWSVVFKQVHAEVREISSRRMALLAKPAVALINATGERLPVSFRVEIDESRFDGAGSAEAAGLWSVVSDSAAATLAKALGLETETLQDLRDETIDKAKSLLDRLRKKP